MDIDIALDRRSHVILSHQIARALIHMIGDGALPAECRLPSTRAFAAQLGVARMTVVEAYAWLEDQGYVRSRAGSGTVVRSLTLAHHRVGDGEGAPVIQPPPVSAPPFDPPKPIGPEIDFRPGAPDLASFPRAQWISAQTSAIRWLSAREFGYGDPLGHPRLRTAIAAYLHRSRGMSASAESIVITAGTSQAIDILLRTLPDHRDLVIEEPGPAVLRRLPQSYDVALHPTAIDAEGLMVDAIPDTLGRCIAYVIPSHQFPTGFLMSIERRSALISWAVRTGSFVVEDDYDGEFAYDGRPTPPLAKLDGTGRVIYAGTFSKTLAPILRTGFMVVPPALLSKVRMLKWWADHGGGGLQQVALARWIEDGGFERHIQRMRKLYRRRYAILRDALTGSLGGRVHILGHPLGMHVSVAVDSRREVGEIVAAAAGEGVRLHPFDIVIPQSEGRRCFVFGFGNLQAHDIDRGVRAFAAAVG